MLHGTDHPKVIVFIASALAELRRKFPRGVISLSSAVTDHWKRRQKETDRPMSSESRKALLQVWQTVDNDLTLRRAAFDIWASAQSDDDLVLLRAGTPDNGLEDRILQQRLERRDRTAIPALIKKFETDNSWWWWHFARGLWSPDLTQSLDDALSRRDGKSDNRDWGLRSALIRMPIAQAEDLLVKHWTRLRFTKHFVQVALFIASPRLCQLVATAVAEAPDPEKLFEHISMHYGIQTEDHPGVTRTAQIESLEPYLDLISSSDLSRFAEACNEVGWFELRKRLFDGRTEDSYSCWRPELAKRSFDALCDRKHSFSIDIDIERALKTGIPWEEFLAVLREWLSERRSIDALNLVSHALQHKGSRHDLEILSTYRGMPEETAETIVANTRFAVYRKSLE
jgi:hypothetical protein